MRWVLVEVAGLFIYPIKGARAVSVRSVELDSSGMNGDRQFAVFKDGERCNVKQIPGIMSLAAEWQSKTLKLTYPGSSGFGLDTSESGPSASEHFRGSDIPITDMGDDVAAWLSDSLHEPVRLGRITEPSPFIIPLPEFTAVHGEPQHRFVDAAPIMLANVASLDDLNRRLDDPVEMARFRPNIVLTGLDAYSEDDVHTFSFNQVELKQVAPCERCKVVTMDLATAETSKEPLATLAKYRRRENDYAGGVMFGSYLAVTQGGRLSVNEEMIL